MTGNPFAATTPPDRASIGLPESPLMEAAKAFSEIVAAEHGRALIVGGFVRDALLGIPSDDLDLEVYGVAPERIETLLERQYPGRVSTVGKAFGILKVHLGEGLEFDVSVPRRESKKGKGHRGFLVESDPGMSVEDAARRRDFTINAMSADPLTGELIDPFGGRKDLDGRVLRVVDPERFQDDPLRVYRAIQLAARFGLIIEPTSFELMRQMVDRGDLEELAKERITEEWKKLLLKAERPSIGFTLARDLGIIERDYPELHALIGTEQEHEWHPEGDVWIHTLLSVDRAAEIIRQPERGFDDDERLQVMLGTLCHDLGKPVTTESIDGRIRSRGHEGAGEEPTRALCARLSFSDDVAHAAVIAATDHLKPRMLAIARHKNELTDESYANAVRKFIKRIAPMTWRVLLAVAEADARGRTLPNAATEPFIPGEMFDAAVERLNIAEAAKPLLQGRDLLDLGVTAGPLMGKIIDEIERLRDEGKIRTKAQALDEAREIIERP